MMLPLWTSVTESRPFAIAYSIAFRTSRSVPSCETGLIPIDEVSGKRIFRTPISSWRNATTFFAASVPASHSIPA